MHKLGILPMSRYRELVARGFNPAVRMSPDYGQYHAVRMSLTTDNITLSVCL